MVSDSVLQSLCPGWPCAGRGSCEIHLKLSAQGAYKHPGDSDPCLEPWTPADFSGTGSSFAAGEGDAKDHRGMPSVPSAQLLGCLGLSAPWASLDCSFPRLGSGRSLRVLTTAGLGPLGMKQLLAQITAQTPSLLCPVWYPSRQEPHPPPSPPPGLREGDDSSAHPPRTLGAWKLGPRLLFQASQPGSSIASPNFSPGAAGSVLRSDAMLAHSYHRSVCSLGLPRTQCPALSTSNPA